VGLLGGLGGETLLFLQRQSARIEQVMEDDFRLVLFLKKEPQDGKQKVLEDRLRALPDVADARYVSRQEAMAELRRQDPELVESVGLPFAIPLAQVERTLDLREQTVRSVAGSPMLVLRDAALPLVDLATALGYPSGGRASHAVIVRSRKHRLALALDHLVGQRELVTRPLPSELGDRAALSGGAVLSNGDIALIVDCDAIDEVAALRRPRLAHAA